MVFSRVWAQGKVLSHLLGGFLGCPQHVRQPTLSEGTQTAGPQTAGTQRPRSPLLPLVPTPPSPTTGGRGGRVAARSPTRRGYLEPAPRPSSSSRSRSRAASRAATSAATAAALSATGPGIPTSLPPRCWSSPHPFGGRPSQGRLRFGRQPNPCLPDVVFRGKGRRLAPPTGAGRRGASTSPPELGRWSRGPESACAAAPRRVRPLEISRTLSAAFLLLTWAELTHIQGLSWYT